MLDLRSLDPASGRDSTILEARAHQGTRFVLMLACEHCLATQTITRNGVERCIGCRRTVLSKAREG